jgi:hypothetical protein
MLYRINQYHRRVYQFETKSSPQLPKPIYLKPLTLIWMKFRRLFRSNAKMSSGIFRSRMGPRQSLLGRYLSLRFRSAAAR